MAWRPVARACLVGVGWWRWTARVADSGRAGALTVVWPASAGPARDAYVSQPAAYVHMLASQPASAVQSLAGALLDACPVQCSCTASAYSSPGALYCCTAVRQGTVAERTGSCTSVQLCLVDLVFVGV